MTVIRLACKSRKLSELPRKSRVPRSICRLCHLPIDEIGPSGGHCQCIQIDEADPSQCYVIRSGEFIKIGYATRPKKRLRELQTANPHELEILCLFAYGKNTERHLHRLLHPWNTSGEWFQVCDELRRRFNDFLATASNLLYGGQL